MIKRLHVLILGLFLLPMLTPGLVEARSGPVVLESSVQAGFPSQLSFSLAVENDVDITDIRLSYQVERTGFARVTSEVYIEFTPDTLVEVEWALDMRKTGGFPPGSVVWYWWTVTGAGGGRVATSPEKVSFDDTRYSWRSLTDNSVTLYWYQGDDAFAHRLMTSVRQALTRLKTSTGAQPENPVSIYIYADAGDLQGAMIYPQEWTGGVAFTRYDTIAIGINPANLQWGERAIAHELTHLVIHQITLNPYGGLPTWLDEGLAMYTEGDLEPQLAAYLETAQQQGGLISVRSLASPFSAYAGEATLSYTQSHSVVEYLIGSYGQSKMLDLLLTFKEGSGYDTALEKVYGFDMDDLDAEWKDYIGEGKYLSLKGSGLF
ncbi:peptidase MA family metallohydrolase [Chloroflexota bacterium]